ncbi:hypothetical protein M8C21_007183 [Ambrosia artemisiifolia]|uniref:Uncharacterized protein n=1 Tax=Ambrosia artemisiifolia TaxID=4212 RepID=A0AAD5GVG1_AMBAR|nr:hypothetical protein M8C21_007183 [Ambrosia artemisiifolia]
MILERMRIVYLTCHIIASLFRYMCKTCNFIFFVCFSGTEKSRFFLNKSIFYAFTSS